MRYSRQLVHAVFGYVLLLLTRMEVQADDFILKTGAQVRGEWLNRDDTASHFYLVATEHGARIRLERSRVVEVVRQSESQRQYDRLAPTVADTIDGHLLIAKWCHEHELQQQREHHLQRVIELDPDHEFAHRALGYSEIGGQWVKKDEHLASKGYVRYKGKWRLPQEIDLVEQRQSEELAKKEWFVKLSRWRSQLNGEKRHAALENIRQVRDPLAIEAIGRLLQVERDRRMRLTYVEVLGRIGNDQAVVALVELALSDRDEEVYYACVAQLAARVTPPLMRQFVLALKSRDNAKVNRAAIALGSLGDQSAIPPLIDALVTRHDTVLPGNDMISTTFSRGGSMSQSGDTFTSGPTAPQVIAQQMTNQEVLKTLVKLSGVSFSFDQQAWRNWYTLEQRRRQSPSVDARRAD